MEKIAVFPGSFDPITIGHESIVDRALTMFDRIYVAIGNNTVKSSFFSIDDRVEMVKTVFKGNSKIEVATYKGLTVDFCRQVEASIILRGVRNTSDFDYEMTIAQANKKIDSSIETIFLLTDPEYQPISSTVVRELLKYGGDVSSFISKKIDVTLYRRG